MNSTEIFAQLQNVTYSDAIDRYNYLKTRFFVEYDIVANILEKDLIDQVETDIYEDISNNPIEDQEAQVEELFNEIRKIMEEKLQGVKKERKDIKNLYKEKKTLAEKAAADLGEHLLSTEELSNYIKTSLNLMGIGSGFSIEDILNQVKSYRNKLILTKINTSKKAYIRATKGYYREALIYKVFSKLFENLDTLPVLSTGSIKNTSGKDTIYDTYINFFGNIKNNFNLMANEKVDVGYGIQSKSWTAPWERNSENLGFFYEKYGFSVGGNKNLLSMSGLEDSVSSLYSWTKSVLFLEKHATEAIGENQLGFVTGKNFYWTADLIANFRAMNYFLAFGYRHKKSLSPTIRWQTPSAIND